MGACEAIGGNVMTDAFGIVTLIAMAPLITIQILGLYERRKHSYKVKKLIKELCDLNIKTNFQIVGFGTAPTEKAFKI